MKLTKFGILVNKTTSLFTSVRDSNISRGMCENFGNSGGEGGNFGGKFWKIQRGGGGGHTANRFHRGGMDIFWNHT